MQIRLKGKRSKSGEKLIFHRSKVGTFSSIHHSFSPSIHLFIYPIDFLTLSVYQSVRLSVRPSIRPALTRLGPGMGGLGQGAWAGGPGPRGLGRGAPKGTHLIVWPSMFCRMQGIFCTYVRTYVRPYPSPAQASRPRPRPLGPGPGPPAQAPWPRPRPLGPGPSPPAQAPQPRPHKPQPPAFYRTSPLWGPPGPGLPAQAPQPRPPGPGPLAQAP